MATITLKVTGMSCGHCVKSVTEALVGVNGVRTAKVDLNAGKATVEYDENVATTRALVGAVMEEGYVAEEATA